MEPEKREKVLEKMENGEAKGLIDARRIAKKEEAKEVPPVEGKYRVIYADPPWSCGDKLTEGYRAAENH